MIVFFLLQDFARDVELANDSRKPPIMGQAIQKLVKAGNEAVPAILSFMEAKGHNGLSLAFADSLGEFKDERIAALCVKLVEDKGFYWRPAAMRSLSLLAAPEHRDLFRRGLSDPLWGAREASVRGLEALKDAEGLRPLLADEIYAVRGQAAKTLYTLGDPAGLPVLVEALREDTRWFGIDYGQIAREDAWNFLKKISGDDFGFKPWEPEARRTEGLAKWDAWMDQRDADWRKKVPEKARARKDEAKYEFGFELRSCQKGDFFFRIDAEGNLVLGCYDLQRAKLSPEELAAFRGALKSFDAVDIDVPYGQGGCDFEQYYLRPSGSQFDRLWGGIGGRPAEVEEFIAASRGLLKAKFAEGVAQEFREKVTLFRGVE
jgi:hypothetical protein